MHHRESSTLLDRAGIAEALQRIAAEILSREAEGELALVGIRSRGVPLARRLAARIGELGPLSIPVGTLDITLYRDDLSSSQPVVRGTDFPFAVDRRRIVLVDDVLHTGRTVRAALAAIVDFGRPERIELMALVDRGGRELPIQADYVGLSVNVPRRQMVQVLVEEEDGRDQVVLLEEDPSA